LEIPIGRKYNQKKMKMNLTLSLFFLLNTINIFGQIATQNIQDPSYIEVHGNAKIEIVPDEIYIGITLNEKNVNKLKLTVDEQEENLKTTLMNLGIGLSDLSITDANTNKYSIRWQKKDYLTKKEFKLKVPNTSLLDKVFQELEKLEISEAFIAGINHSKMDSLKQVVNIMAIQSAKNKADYLLQAIREKTGKPLIVKEVELINNLNPESTPKSKISIKIDAE
jgi:uncharacterized protein